MIEISKPRRRIGMRYFPLVFGLLFGIPTGVVVWGVVLLTRILNTTSAPEICIATCIGLLAARTIKSAWRRGPFRLDLGPVFGVIAIWVLALLLRPLDKWSALIICLAASISVIAAITFAKGGQGFQELDDLAAENAQRGNQ
jgi:hypothetical protein